MVEHGLLQTQKQKLKDKNKTWSTVKTIITSIIITKTGRQSDIFIFYNFIPIAGRAATWTKGYQYLLFQRKEARLSASLLRYSDMKVVNKTAATISITYSTYPPSAKVIETETSWSLSRLLVPPMVPET